jgi:hypothetical protein
MARHPVARQPYSFPKEGINTDSQGKETNNCHQDKHNQDSAVHEMVIPLGFAVLQLVPCFFAIFHRYSY